jgi:hypothetical protein
MITDPFGNPYPRRLVSRMRAVQRIGPDRPPGSLLTIAALNPGEGSLLSGSGHVLWISNTSGGIVLLTLAQGPDRNVFYSDNLAPGSPLQMKMRYDGGLYVLSPSQPQVQLSIEVL